MWLLDLADAQLRSGLGLTSEDITVLRAARCENVTSSSHDQSVLAAPGRASESDQESIGSQESGGVRSVKEAIIPNYDQRRGGPMASPTRIGDFSLCGDRTAPVANGVGARLKRLARRLTDALEAQHRSGVEREAMDQWPL